MHGNIPNTIHNPLPTIPRTMEITGKVRRRCRGAGGAGDKRQRQCAAVAVTRPAAAAREVKRVQCQPPERRPRHRGGRDGGAGAIVPSFEKGGGGGSGTRRVVPEGVDAACRSKMAPWAIERAERARRQRGGEENGGEAASIPSLVGLRWRWTTMVRMTVAAGGTKQQPTP